MRIALAPLIAAALLTHVAPAPPAVHRGAAPVPAKAPTPVVVELFTSEGCSDCPPADVVLQKLIDGQPVAGADVIALGEHVDYWDQQGWRDRFSSAASTFRQRLYVSRFALESAYTPQMVVDGRAQFVGSDGRAALQAIERAAAAPHATVRLEVDVRDANALGIVATVSDPSNLSRGDRADVTAVITEDHLRSEVTRGENRGRTLSHAAVVRSTTSLGQMSAGDVTLRGTVPIDAGWKRDELKAVVYVQGQRGRAILGAAAVALRTLRR
jgi:hypothetical protein